VAAQCPLCGSVDSQLVLTGRDEVIGHFVGAFQIRRCRDCPVMYTWPQPGEDELARAYSLPDLPWHDTEPLPQTRHPIRRWLARIAFGHLRWVPPLPPGSRVLDLGCGSGGFLASLKGQAWELVGVDVSAGAVNQGRRLYGLDLRVGTLAEQRFPDGHFDCVFAWHVLEHLPRLWEVLAEIRRVIKPGGWLVAAVPNAAWWGRHLFGAHWRSWWLPYHLYHFTPEALSWVVTRAGFIVERVLFGPAQGDLIASLGLIVPWKPLRSCLLSYNRRITFRHPWALAIKAFLLPLEYALVPIGQSNEFTLAARRPCEDNLAQGDATSGSALDKRVRKE
jgi:SAM-dependent methyltransferase